MARTTTTKALPLPARQVARWAKVQANGISAEIRRLETLLAEQGEDADETIADTIAELTDELAFWAAEAKNPTV